MIDVIIPTYNSGKSLRKTLESISNQTFIGNINVIIVNDGGESDYNLGGLDLDVQELRYEKNKGPGYARNYALERTHSNLITFIDSDDTFTENAIKNLTENIRNADMLVTLENKYNEGPYFSMQNLHGKLYKREMIEKHNIKFPEHLYSAEDHAFNLVYELLSKEILKIDVVTYNYIFNENSIIGKVGFKDFILGRNAADTIQGSLWALKQLEGKVPKDLLDIYKARLLVEFFILAQQGSFEGKYREITLPFLLEYFEYIKDLDESVIIGTAHNYKIEKEDILEFLKIS